MSGSKKIFVSPMDWGLGHASRCIPVIRSIIRQGHEPVIGGTGRSLRLLRVEFPNLNFIELPGYQPVYPGGSRMVFKMMVQVPKFLKTITEEHKALDRLIDELGLDGVISDNRYGLWTRKRPCILMTHQIFIQMPPSAKWVEPFVKQLNWSYIRKFNQCWIPDYEGDSNLSGILSHNGRLPVQTSFIGPLSRFEKGNRQSEYDLLILLSGPEPQRTIFETSIRSQLKNLPYKTLIVQGIPEKDHRSVIGKVETVSFMGTRELNQAMLDSDIILARAGYSNLMDLRCLNKKAILIPTPGQTEQEMLAEHHRSNPNYVFQKQSELNIKQGIGQLLNQELGQGDEKSESIFESEIKNFLDRL